MSAEERFFGPIPGFAEGRSIFAGDDFTERMRMVRLKINEIRKAWKSVASYNALKATVRNFVRPERHPRIVRDLMQEILEGFQDYADTDLNRPTRTSSERCPALELYCTHEGYTYLYSLVYSALRTENVDQGLLVTAVTLVEYLTIDLYNLRLANIGDPRFANYQGITYRGLTVRPEAVEDYRRVAKNKDLTKRNFSIPLGLMSSSIDGKIMKHFAQRQIGASGAEKMHWTIHIHGLDEDLLALYLEDYPESVVTTICAMPVGRISAYPEQEILLRGAFFHIINMESKIEEGIAVHEIVCVAINANRDHTSEDGSDEGPQQVQRNFFRHIVAASRYEVCASLAAEYSAEDAEVYSTLQKAELQAVRILRQQRLAIVPRSKEDMVVRNTDLADARSEAKSTWLGGSSVNSFPRPYAKLRLEWQEAIAASRWSKVEEILHQEYHWSRSDWYHVGKLRRESAVGVEHEGHTLLHEIASKGPPDESDEEFFYWQKILEKIAGNDAWKTLRTFDSAAKTAQEIAGEQGYDALAELLTPRVKHHVPLNILKRLESQLHSFMQEKAGSLIRQYGFRMPQLPILTEMEFPNLWIPIPHMYGGFAIQLNDANLHVSLFETVPGRHQPRRSTYIISAKQPGADNDC